MTGVRATGMVDTLIGGVRDETVVTIGVALRVGFGKVHADKFGRMWLTGIVNVGILGGTNGLVRKYSVPEEYKVLGAIVVKMPMLMVRGVAQ